MCFLAFQISTRKDFLLSCYHFLSCIWFDVLVLPLITTGWLSLCNHMKDICCCALELVAELVYNTGDILLV